MCIFEWFFDIVDQKLPMWCNGSHEGLKIPWT